jgi:TonB family protein
MDVRVADGSKAAGDNVDGVPGGQLLEGRYRLVRRIATGGMASVYVAEHTRIGRPVAVKILHAQYADDSECVRRFLDEGRTVGTLGHPHIVESTDMGYTSSGAPFLVLELLEGRTLEQELRRQGPLPIQRSVRIAQQIASALAAAHAKGIIHRDLKGGNVFLVNRTDDDHVKVLDFGISKFMEGRGHTQKGKLLGTPWFMSPEQINDPASVDARCDVYSLGVIMYEMLTGKVPFHDVPFPVVFTKILYDEPPPIRSLRPEVTPQLAQLIESAMIKAPAHRVQSMEDFARLLAAIVGPYWLQMRARARTQSDFELDNHFGASGTPMPVLISDASPSASATPPLTNMPPLVRTDAPSLTPPPSLMPTPAGALSPNMAQIISRQQTVPPQQLQRRRMAAIAALAAVLAAAVVFVLVALFPARDSGDGAAKPPAPAPTEASPAPKAETPPPVEAAPAPAAEAPAPAPISPAPISPAPAEPAADKVNLTIKASARGAHAIFRGETYRLPLRKALPRGDGPEPIEITAPNHVTRTMTITLDRDRRLVVDLEREKRAVARESAPAGRPEPPATEEKPPIEATPAPAPVEEPPEPIVEAPRPRPAVTQPPARKEPPPGTVDPKALRRAVGRQRYQVLTCFERGKMDNPQLTGHVVVRITVDPTGEVTSARMSESTLKNRSVDLCITSAIETWTLAAPAGGVSATFDYTFPFNK